MKIKKVLKMSASWCMPCKVYSRTFNDVKNEEKYKDVVFEEIDVEENEELADKYNIRAVPTTVVLDENDNVLSAFNGNVSKIDLEDKLDEIENG